METLEKAEGEKELAGNSDVQMAPECSALQRVLGIDLLFDKILVFAIHNEGSTNKSTVCACKLVNSLWLNRTNAVVRKVGSTLLHLKTEEADKINKFIDTFGDSPGSRIPPYHLTIKPISDTYPFHVYTAETLKTCMECLRRCGGGLKELTVHCLNASWDISEDSTLFSPLSLNLPYLQNMSIQIDGRPRHHQIQEMQGSERDFSNLELPESNGKMQHFLQQILDGSNALKKIVMEFGWNRYVMEERQLHWEIDLKYLKLPESLQSITFVCDPSTLARDLDFLLVKNSRLVNLTSLCLQFRSVKGSELYSVLTNILNALRHQLRKLEIGRIGINSGNSEVIQLPMMPVMPNMKEFTCCEWINEGTSLLHEYFPVLKKFSCEERWNHVLLAWIDSDTRSLTVEDVNIRFNDEKSQSEDGIDKCGLEMEKKVTRLSFAFPNVIRLTVGFGDFQRQGAGMKLIFQKFTQLQALEIRTFEVQGNRQLFNAHLLGISPEEAEALYEQIDGLSFENVRYDNNSSIVNLKELRKLHLSAAYHARSPKYYFLDVAIKLGISKMPNLASFTFTDGLTLKATSEGQQ